MAETAEKDLLKLKVYGINPSDQKRLPITKVDWEGSLEGKFTILQKKALAKYKDAKAKKTTPLPPRPSFDEVSHCLGEECLGEELRCNLPLFTPFGVLL